MQTHKNPKASADALTTTAPIIPGPEWLRPADVKPFCGFGRSHVYNLIDTGAIRSVCLRQKGKSKGVRLISVDSLRSYIASQCEGVAK